MSGTEDAVLVVAGQTVTLAALVTSSAARLGERYRPPVRHRAQRAAGETVLMMSGHDQVPLRCVPHAHADRRIAPLLDWLNARGAATEHSCEGGPFDGWWEQGHWFAPGISEAYISFVTVPDSERAVAALTSQLRDEPDAARLAMLARILACPWLSADSTTPQPFERLWRWQLKVRLPGDAGWPLTTPRMVVDVFFPPEDVDELTSMLFPPGHGPPIPDL